MTSLHGLWQRWVFPPLIASVCVIWTPLGFMHSLQLMAQSLLTDRNIAYLENVVEELLQKM